MMWTWVGFIAGAAIIGILVWLLDPDARRARSYEVELTSREWISDEDLHSRYFPEGIVTADITSRVRRVFAANTGYPAGKLLPDDDLSFFWVDVDMVDLVRELEDGFSIAFTDTEMERTKCTIREVSMLVADKVHSRASR